MDFMDCPRCGAKNASPDGTTICSDCQDNLDTIEELQRAWAERHLQLVEVKSVRREG